MIANEIKNNLSKLSPKLQLELYRYIELLINQEKSAFQEKKGFNFDWEGGLINLKEKFDSVELQHKSLEWR